MSVLSTFPGGAKVEIVDSSTATPLSGLLKGNGAHVEVAAPGTDYIAAQATETELGGIKAAAKTAEDSSEVKIDPATGKLFYKPGAGAYTLPQANDSALGGIIAANKTSEESSEVKIDPDTGKLYSKPGAYVLPAAGAELGGVKADSGNQTGVEAKIGTDQKLRVPQYPAVPTVAQTGGQSTSAVMSQKAVTDGLAGKVNTEAGKGLSSNDFTATEKTKLAGIAVGATANTVVQGTGSSTTNIMSQNAVTSELAGKQAQSNLLRVQNNGTGDGDVIDSDVYTDIFAYQGKLTFKAGFSGKQIKTFYIEEGFVLANDGGIVTKINVDFTEKPLPYTADSKMYLVGYTQGNIPLFRRGILIPNPESADNGKVVKVDSQGNYELGTAAGTYVLPQASAADLGGIRAANRTGEETSEVKIDPATGKLYSKPGAGAYTLPQASANTLGGIMAAAKGSGDTKEVKIDAGTGKLYAPDQSYTLPKAGASQLGGIMAPAKTSGQTEKVGISTTGELFVTPQRAAYNLPVAGANLGGVKADAKQSTDTQAVRIGTDNKLYTTPGAGAYTLPPATANNLGGVKAAGAGAGDTVEVKIDSASQRLKVPTYPTPPAVVQGTGTSTGSVMSQNAVTSALAGKVNTEAGKGLSTNDFTTAEKNKLGGIAAGATANTVVQDTGASQTSIMSQNAVTTKLAQKQGIVAQKYINMAAAGYSIDETADNNIYINTTQAQPPALSIAKISEIPVIENIIIDASEHGIMLFGSTVGIGAVVIDGVTHDISSAGYQINSLYKVAGLKNATTVIFDSLISSGSSVAVEQTTGQSQTAVMSQKASTDSFVKKSGDYMTGALEVPRILSPAGSSGFKIISASNDDMYVINSPSLGGSSIHFLDPPTADGDAANKGYVDTKVGKTGNETVGGVKTFTDGIKTNSVTAKDNNVPLKLAASAVELESRALNGTTVTAKVTVAGSENPATTPHMMYPWEDGTMNLGSASYRFKDIYLSGNINSLPAAEIQRRSNLLRVQNDGTADIIDSDTYTDVFAYQGKLTFKAGFTGRQIKSFFINKGFELTNDGGIVTKINVDFTEEPLPYTADAKMYLVGYTLDDTPLFTRAEPAEYTVLPASGTALQKDVLYNIPDSAKVGTYQFVAPASGHAHGRFFTAASAAVTFGAGAKYLGAAPNIEANKQYEFDVLNNVWAVQEVV